DYIKVNVKSVQQFQHKTGTMWSGHKAALEQLVGEAKGGKKVNLYCESAAEIRRISEIITQDNKKVPANFKIVQGFVNQGFLIGSLKTIVISHHEIFGQYAIRRRQRQIRAGAAVDTLADLQAGDYVVHVSYGVGKYSGIEIIKDKKGTSEHLTIEYDGGVKIHVSANNISLIQKYIGTSPRRPKLSKIGSKKWIRQKEKVAESVENLASELLGIQAKRQALGGIKHTPDSNWQREFEEAFPYQETADQITAAKQIKADMQTNIAMDRLLCGDVGYGKTELSMRAAFKAVENGRQAAVLVPTTVLSVQHGRSFAERFADFPVCIEVLNRFRTTKQAKDVTDRAREGKVDILIGTHRLLSKDVEFKDLGLLIIDEEQRFGVRHKEKLKKMRINVDILTMTATPIPRTLHMSLLGLRDISSLGTPPLDRRSIVTQVTAYNEQLIRKAIFRELNRQGQVFFLHNRVKTIEKKAYEIRRIIDDSNVRVAVAHGQMPKSRLEREMIDFVNGKTDVLVCTTIIESGLDIPNANTIFIDDADRFGLAELHQLRGRVGRYKHRAYAYMLLPKARSITPIAGRRLKAIEEYSHLGAGFRIALRDLEIRGAGNILGPEQSGHIQIVGYQMYCQLLADGVRRLKNEKTEPIPSAVVELGFSTYIPKNYIPTDRYRMEVYRKIAVARGPDDIMQINNELKDVYGPIPQEVELLLELAEIRIAVSRYGIKSIITSGQNLVFSFSETVDKKADSLFGKVKGTVTVSDAKTVYLRLGKNYFEQRTLLTILKKIFRLK
ncbi:MAG: transcription-repair coupling factor, partial [Planctomycetota bacterium]